MSTVARSTDSSSRGSPGPASATDARDRLIARICLVITLAVAVWSALELVNLAGRHTNGAELYGVMTAALATFAGCASVVLLRSPQGRGLFAVVVLVIWAVVALAGIAGVAAHLIGPVPGHGPIDVRPRPVFAPLVFSLLGLTGAPRCTSAAAPVFGAIAPIPEEDIRCRNQPYRSCSSARR